jgi:hypothetical protein
MQMQMGLVKVLNEDGAYSSIGRRAGCRRMVTFLFLRSFVNVESRKQLSRTVSQMRKRLKGKSPSKNVYAMENASN